MAEWMDEIAAWFSERENTSRLGTVLGYTGCRELWLQAELAMWLERRGHLAADGDWDTNLRVPGHGRCDLAVRDGKGGLQLALEIKVLGGGYQTKVFTGSARTLNPLAAKLKKSHWQLGPREFKTLRGFGLLPDYARLRALRRARKRILLLIVDNRTDGETVLGEALSKVEFPATKARSIEISTGLHARIWLL